jgi:hypothetical protein
MSHDPSANPSFSVKGSAKSLSARDLILSISFRQTSSCRAVQGTYILVDVVFILHLLLLLFFSINVSRTTRKLSHHLQNFG